MRGSADLLGNWPSPRNGINSSKRERHDKVGLISASQGGEVDKYR
jgi:hypothetical protein